MATNDFNEFLWHLNEDKPAKPVAVPADAVEALFQELEAGIESPADPSRAKEFDDMELANALIGSGDCYIDHAGSIIKSALPNLSARPTFRELPLVADDWDMLKSITGLTKLVPPPEDAEAKLKCKCDCAKCSAGKCAECSATEKCAAFRVLSQKKLAKRNDLWPDQKRKADKFLARVRHQLSGLNKRADEPEIESCWDRLSQSLANMVCENIWDLTVP